MDDLEQRLREAGDEWRRRQADPPSIETLMHALDRSPRRRLSARRTPLMAAFATAVVVVGVVVVGPSLDALRTGTDPGNGPAATPTPTATPLTTPSAPPPTLAPIEGTVSAEAIDGDYRLVFDVAKATWNTDESIIGTARLERAGQSGWSVSGSGSGPIVYQVTEVGGSRRLEPVMTLDCATHLAESRNGLQSPLKKSGSWTAEDPNAAFYEAFFKDPLYRLAAGDWEITAIATFSEPGCGRNQHELRATVRIRVVPPPEAGEREPAHAEAGDGQFRLVFDAPKTTWTSNESISASAQLHYSGAETVTVAGSGGGVIGFSAVELGGTRRFSLVGQDDCAAYDVSSAAPLVARLWKGGGWDDGDPNAAFYVAFFKDSLYRLPAGDWEITAHAEFHEGECGGERHRIQATFQIRVVDPPDEGDAIRLRPAPDRLGCDAIGLDYRSFTIRIDPAADDQVWAVTDRGDRLTSYWERGFQGGTATDPVIRDPGGQVVARDGEQVDLPDLDWPRLHGYFVCPGLDAFYVLLKDPQ